MGRPLWKPTDEEIAKIRLYASVGLAQEQIGAIIGKSVDTLTRNEKVNHALAVGRAETIAKVGGKLVSKALAGDTTSMIFYLKTQAGWHETTRNEHSGPGGGPLQLESRNMKQLTEQQLAALAALDAWPE